MGVRIKHFYLVSHVNSHQRASITEEILWYQVNEITQPAQRSQEQRSHGGSDESLTRAQKYGLLLTNSDLFTLMFTAVALFPTCHLRDQNMALLLEKTDHPLDGRLNTLHSLYKGGGSNSSSSELVPNLAMNLPFLPSVPLPGLLFGNLQKPGLLTWFLRPKDPFYDKRGETMNT